MSLNHLQVRSMGMTMSGQPTRYFLARERISIHKYRVDVSKGFPQTIKGPWVCLFNLSDLLIRAYCKTTGYDDDITFSGEFRAHSFGLTDGVPNNPDSQENGSLFPGLMPDQGGAPVSYVPDMQPLFSLTHCRVYIVVGSGDWDPKFDLQAVVEFWANGWRWRRDGVIGTQNTTGNTNPVYEKSDARADLSESRGTL